MDGLDIGTGLRYYKKEEIQNAIVNGAEKREVAIKYGEKGFGKRPDNLRYPNDVLELAKSGATSFHCSEELWQNALQLNPNLSRKELEELRVGWDLVLDVDFKIWESTKMIGAALVSALKSHGIKSITAKFSGNKGFHIGVPFEAFPKEINGEDTSNFFPDGVRKIAEYLVYYIDNKDNHFSLSEKIMAGTEWTEYMNKNSGALNEFTEEICEKCSTPVKLKAKGPKSITYICPNCEKRHTSNEREMIMCPTCKKPMTLIERTGKEDSCKNCGSIAKLRRFNLAIDTVLISSRHLFRSVYSLHEKSGLASVPINPYKLLEFDKSAADPEKVIVGKYKFLERRGVRTGEAEALLKKSLEYHKDEEEPLDLKKKEYEIPEEAALEEFFPPCIKNVLKGLKDGKKRSMFILVNYLTSVGWSYEQIEERLVEWNKKNDEPLREVNIKGHIRYHKQNKKKVLPPNCDNKGYYIDMQICTPDNFCSRIKNPVTYTLRKPKSKPTIKKANPKIKPKQNS